MPPIAERELEGLEQQWQWLCALKTGDLATLDRILDPLFVSTPWSSRSEVLLKGQYLREARRTRLKQCELQPPEIQVFGDFAIVSCHIRCEYDLGQRWSMDLTMTDVWVNREGTWKALHRDASPLPAQHAKEGVKGRAEQTG